MSSHFVLPLVLEVTMQERDAGFVLDRVKKGIRLVTAISAIRFFAANIVYLDVTMCMELNAQN